MEIEEFYQAEERVVLFNSPDKSEFIPSQVIYVEDGFNGETNHFFLHNFEIISDIFEKVGFDFIYLPKVVDVFKQPIGQSWNTICYFNPFLNSRSPKNFFKLFIDSSLSFSSDIYAGILRLFSDWGYNEKIRPGLLRLADDSETNNFTFEYVPFDMRGQGDLWMQIATYLQRICPVSTIHLRNDDPIRELYFRILFRERNIHNCLSEIHDDYPENGLMGDAAEPLRRERPASKPAPKKEYDYFMRKIVNDVLEAKEFGVCEKIFRDTVDEFLKANGFNPDEIKKISRLSIDSEYKIYLSDYASIDDYRRGDVRGKRVDMATLPKTVYILFLWHPEGIYLKEMSYYKEELNKIYKTISNRENEKVMQESIEALCHFPVENSLNEKITNIKSAFTKKIADFYAKRYYVCKTGEYFQVTLTPDLIELPGELDPKQNKGIAKLVASSEKKRLAEMEKRTGRNGTS